MICFLELTKHYIKSILNSNVFPKNWDLADQCHSLGRLWSVRYENAYKLLLPLLPNGQSTNQPAIICWAVEKLRVAEAEWQAFNINFH